MVMTSCALTAPISMLVVVAAGFEAFPDEGLSLLQVNAQPHREHREVSTLDAWGGATIRAGGSQCDDSEVLTYAECLEVLRTGIDSYKFDGRYTPKLQFSPGTTGCYIHVNNQLYYNPGPGKPFGPFRPICSPEGTRAQEMLDPMLGPVDKPYNYAGPKPTEFELGEKGAQCDGCGILTLDQCITAMRQPEFRQSAGIVGTGMEVQLNPGMQACYKANNNNVYFNTGTPGNPLQDYAPSAGLGNTAGVSWPICGKCTTTTTIAPEPEAPEPEDEGSAVGDPHMITNSGNHFDIQH